MAWNPFQSLVGCFRKLRKADQLHKQARQAATPAESVRLLRESLRLDDLRSVRFDLAMALARNKEWAAGAAEWLWLIRRGKYLFLTEEQLAVMLQVVPQVATEALAALRVPRPSHGGYYEWAMERDRDAGTRPIWNVSSPKHRNLQDFEPALKYVALLLSHETAGPGRAVFCCEHVSRGDGPDTLTDLGKVTCEWNAAHQVRCVSFEEAPPRRF